MDGLFAYLAKSEIGVVKGAGMARIMFTRIGTKRGCGKLLDAAGAHLRPTL